MPVEMGNNDPPCQFYYTVTYVFMHSPSNNHISGYILILSLSFWQVIEGKINIITIIFRHFLGIKFSSKSPANY